MKCQITLLIDPELLQRLDQIILTENTKGNKMSRTGTIAEAIRTYIELKR